MIGLVQLLDYVPETLYDKNMRISKSAADITQAQVLATVLASLAGMMGSLYTELWE